MFIYIYIYHIQFKNYSTPLQIHIRLPKLTICWVNKEKITRISLSFGQEMIHLRDRDIRTTNIGHKLHTLD